METMVKSKFVYKPNPARRVKLMGCPIENYSLQETVQEVHKIIENKAEPVQHCVVNAGKFILMEKEPRLKKIVYSCPIINADGQSVVWGLNLMKRPISERVTGIDLMELLLVEGCKRNYRFYFLGATEAILNKMLKILRKKHPSLIVAGAQSGYFTDEENPEIVKSIVAAKADILFVAMGSPKKEYWLADNLKNLKTPFCMGVGGSFDVIAGKAKRAPRWIQRIGMEWFFRFIQEPLRLWRRYLVGNFVFLALAVSSYFEKRIQLDDESDDDLRKKEIT